MSLPWDVEKIISAFQRAHSVFSDQAENAKPYTEGIRSTLSFLPLDFQKHNIYIPDLPNVLKNLYSKTGRRLENLMQKLIEILTAMQTQLSIMNTKLEELSQSPSFSTSIVLTHYYTCQSSATAAEQLLNDLKKTSEIKYFS